MGVFLILFLIAVGLWGATQIMVDPKIKALAEAIATHGEGFGKPGAIPTLANNPGDIKNGDVSGLGTLGAGITKYATIEQGWSALYHQLQLIEKQTSAYYKRSMTFYEFADEYTGKDHGPQWAEGVATALGVDPNSTLDDYFNA